MRNLDMINATAAKNSKNKAAIRKSLKRSGRSRQYVKFDWCIWAQFIASLQTSLVLHTPLVFEFDIVPCRECPNLRSDFGILTSTEHSDCQLQINGSTCWDHEMSIWALSNPAWQIFTYTFEGTIPRNI